MKNIAISLLLLSCTLALADEATPTPPAEPGPWLTGPLLAPSGHVVPPGNINYEPYFYWSQVGGGYNAEWHNVNKPNFWQLNIQPTFQCGLFAQTEFDFAPQVFWNETLGESLWRYADWPCSIGLQLLGDKPGKWWPATKLKLNFNIPFGKYQDLNPKKLGTDIGGSGTWAPGLGLVFSRLFHWGGVHFLAARWYFAYTMPTPVFVKGFNNYGGGFHTHGRVYPGHNFTTDLGFEFTMSQSWALALDVFYAHTNKTRFKGRTGISAPGVPAVVGGPSQETVSLAPALEYNWNDRIGIIGGPWFTIAGRNSSKFIQWIFAINIYE